MPKKAFDNSCLFSRALDTCNCPFVANPKLPNITKYETIDVIKLYLPIESTPRVLDKYG